MLVHSVILVGLFKSSVCWSIFCFFCTDNTCVVCLRGEVLFLLVLVGLACVAEF